jgi:hypothetical protein
VTQVEKERAELGKDLLATLEEIKRADSFGDMQRDLLLVVLRIMIKTLYGVRLK